MHVIQCPRCQARFKVAAALSNARLRCAKCRQPFIGSTVEETDSGVAKGEPSPFGSAAPTPRPAVPGGPATPPGAEAFAAPASRSGAGARPPVRSGQKGVLLLVACVLGIIGVVGMVLAAVYLQTHPSYEIVTRDPVTGEIVERRRGSPEEAQRVRQDEQARKEGAAKPVGQEPDQVQTVYKVLPAGTTLPAGAAGDGEVVTSMPAEEIKEDPNLDVSKKIVSGGTVGEISYVCGRVLNKYPKPLQDVTVTAYVKGTMYPPVKYVYVPAGEEARYSIKLAENVAVEDVKVAAVAGKTEDRLLVWKPEADRIQRNQEEDKTVWSGLIRNKNAVPVQNVKVYFDFFTGEGLFLGRAVADVAKPIGAGKTERFSVDFTENVANVSDVFVIRAVGEKY